MEMLWVNLCTFIPYEAMDIEKKSHPWLTSKCEDAIRNKNAAEQTSSFDEARTKCAVVLTEEHQKYIAALRLKIFALDRSGG